MLSNFILLAWRNLVKHKTFSFINIFGLAAGISFVFLIAVYVWGEWRVNQSIPDNDRIYLVRSKWKKPEMGMDLTTLAPLGKSLKRELSRPGGKLLPPRRHYAPSYPKATNISERDCNPVMPAFSG